MKIFSTIRGFLVVVAMVFLFEFLDFLGVKIPSQAIILILIIFSAFLANSPLDNIFSVLGIIIYGGYLLFYPFNFSRYFYSDLAGILTFLIAAIMASIIINLLKRQLAAARIKLEYEKAKDEAILGSIGDGVVAVDKVGRIILMNDAAEEMLGFGKKEMPDVFFHEKIHLFNSRKEPIVVQDSPITVALTTGKESVIAPPNCLYLVCCGKDMFATGANITPIFSGKKVVGATMIFRDSTKEVEIDRAKSEFISLASHQLRTPLSTINWYVELLQEDKHCKKLSKNQQGFLKEIAIGSMRMRELINSLLNISRLDSGSFSATPKSINIPLLVDNIIHGFLPQIRDKEIFLKKDFSKDIPRINMDEKHITIILQNLLSNAIKYSRNKKMIKLKISGNRNKLFISVADQGCGIPPEACSKIFMKFFRANNARKIDQDGSGLGLYMVKSIVEQTGGRIWFESLPGKGSIFYVTMPFSVSNKNIENKGIVK
ncbi:MAG TPA: ATP-binding protein [Patescibacteria group bacterium]|nr:ATP-binding protein [Patescibacteria group bacterium]